MYDKGLLKEYGSRCNVGIKKQYVEHMINKIYVED